MIKVEIKRKDGYIREMIVRDHAGYRKKGEDLVCAGVSCITVGALNALDRLCEDICELEMRDAYIRVAVKLLEDHDTQVILNTMRIQLSTMQELYENFIKITDQEV